MKTKREHPLYWTWRNMINRCLQKRRKDYARYGGRGIKVCQRWRNNFAAFVADMGPRPTPHHTIERKNNNGNYTPSNCIWSTRAAQTVNRGCAQMITYRGRRQSLTEWSVELGIKKPTLWMRLFHYKLPVNQAMQTSDRRSQ